MKVLLVHNYYQIRGGEDAVFENERVLLEDFGCDVSVFVRHNEEIVGVLYKLFTALGMAFSITSYIRFKKNLKALNPDIVHVHNYFPLISPSVFFACHSLGIPIVHTLHNYRAICPTALLMCEGKVNLKSVYGLSWWAVPKKVYRNSIVGTFLLASMVELHKKFGTWNCKVDKFITLTEFAKNKFIEAGFPAEKICVKPNFIEDPFKGADALPAKNDGALFVGRFSEEKGIDVLLKAWQGRDYPLVLAGDGPLFEQCEADFKGESISFLGSQSSEQVHGLMSEARFLVMPSICYEGFPIVLLEAFAHGVPVICSRLGGMAEIVSDKVTGLHFEAGDVADLNDKIQWMINHPDDCAEMGLNARAEYLEKYTPEVNYQQLMAIYQEAINDA